MQEFCMHVFTNIISIIFPFPGQEFLKFINVAEGSVTCKKLRIIASVYNHHYFFHSTLIIRVDTYLALNMWQTLV